MLQPGEVFHGRYRIVGFIAAGAMGEVYEVWDDRPNGRRALKLMKPGAVADADKRARFALEATVTGPIESDHLVRVYDAGIDEATSAPFLLMELLHGEELGAISKRGPLPSADVMSYLSQAALALDKTHAAGIVHRDLKPANLFIARRDDGSPSLKIVDFGIAKVVATGDSKQKTKTLGTPFYMAPEQMRGAGDIGPRADVYAIGHVAYTLLSGEPYWQEESQADPSLYVMLTKIMGGAQEPPVARALRRRGLALPAAFDAWFFACTAPAEQARPERAGAAIAALAEMFTQRDPAPASTVQVPFVPLPQFPANTPEPGHGWQPAPYAAPPPAPASKPPWLAIACGAVVVAGGVAAAVVLRGGQGSAAGAAKTATEARHDAPAPPAPPPAASAAAAPDPVLYSDAFNDPGSWIRPEGAHDLLWAGGGALFVSAIDSAVSTWPASAPLGDVADFTLDLDIARSQGAPELFSGISFRVTGADAYVAGIDLTGRARIMRYDSGAQDYKLIAEAQSRAAKRGMLENNHVKLVMRGATVTLFVNDELAVTGNDATLQRGRIALFVMKGAAVKFGRFTVRAPAARR